MRIAIIGAGLTGLTAAFELSKENHEITIYEKSSDVGGLIQSISFNNEAIEKYYHHIFNSDSELISLIEELGLLKNLKWYEPKNAFFINQKLYPFTTPIDLLLFKELSFFDRIRLGLMIFKAKGIKNWHELDKITAKEWIIKNTGEAVYQKIWGPLLNSKFDVDADNISGTWIWNKLKLRGSTRGKNINKEVLGYMDKSFNVISSEIFKRLNNNGSKFLFNTEIESINKTNDNKLCISSKENSLIFDKVIVTCAPDVLNSISAPFGEVYKSRIRAIKYKANICMVMLLNKRISDYYWITVSDKEIPFVLAIEHTNLVTDERYGGSVLYLSRYIDRADNFYSLDDDSIKNSFMTGFKKLFPSFKEEDVLESYISRSDYAQPVTPVGYKDIMLPYKTSVPNLYIASMSSIYPEDRGQNYAVREGRKIAREIFMEG